MKFLSANDLPKEWSCKVCTKQKPLAEMMVTFNRKGKWYRTKPRCKDCHNEKERGNRREYKRKYLKRWIAGHRKTLKSYRQKPAAMALNLKRSQKFFDDNAEAIRIQKRLRTHGFKCDLSQAREYLETFGPCYPTRYGLSKSGMRECERIRGKQRYNRNLKLKLRGIDIRIMVYEDAVADDKSLMIAPDKQPRPYQSRSRGLSAWHQKQREAKAA